MCWLTWYQLCQGPMRSQFECWLWLRADCTQSSTTRWGTLNWLCLAKSWQTEHHCCSQPEKYWKLLNQHNSWGFVAGLQLHRPVRWCQVRHGAVQTHGCAHLLGERAQLPAAARCDGSCRGAFKGKMLWTAPLPSNSCFVCREGSWLSLCPWSLLWCCLKALGGPSSYLASPTLPTLPARHKL